jgi:histidyl-tRNA synthetase
LSRPAVTRLTGTADLLPDTVTARQEVLARLQSFFRLYGYEAIDTPVLERTDLYLKKSGSALTSRLYTFHDQGGHKVSLRPEFTASVLRLFLEGKDWPLPVRWQYAGPVFRYQDGSAKGVRQFTQVGAELLGAAGHVADAEIIGMAYGALQGLPLQGLRVVLAYPGLVGELLKDYGLSERARAFLVSSLGRLKAGGQAKQEVMEQAKEMGLVRPQGTSRVDAAANGQSDVQALLRTLLDQPEPTGSRTPEEIMAGYLRKQRTQEDPQRFHQAVEMLADLTQVHGAPRTALHEASQLLKRNRRYAAGLQELQETIALLLATGLDEGGVTVDFGVAPELAYYSGFVFELWVMTSSGERLLGSGGRYDGLAKALGGEGDLPACGFACILEQIVEVLPRGQRSALSPQGSTLVVPESPAAVAEAIIFAQGLRSKGAIAQTDLVQRPLQESLAYGRRAGLQRVVVVDAQGHSQDYPLL